MLKSAPLPRLNSSALIGSWASHFFRIIAVAMPPLTTVTASARARSAFSRWRALTGVISQITSSLRRKSAHATALRCRYRARLKASASVFRLD